MLGIVLKNVGLRIVFKICICLDIVLVMCGVVFMVVVSKVSNCGLDLSRENSCILVGNLVRKLLKVFKVVFVLLVVVKVLINVG